MREEMIKTGEFIRQHCQADDFTLKIAHYQDLYTRFAQNGITQHSDGMSNDIRLEVAFENKTGEAAVNQTDRESLLSLIQKAENIARLNKPDPEFVSSEKSHPLRDLVKPATATVDLKVETIVDGIEMCIKNAQKKEAKVSGISERNIIKHYMLTKNGFAGYDERANFSHSMTMKKGGIETKVSGSINDYAQFSLEQMIEQLNNQFDALKEPQTLEKGHYPVIMRPQAVIQWLYYLAWTYQLREADEGTNPYTDQMEKKFFGDNFTLLSKVTDPKIDAPLFNRNGIPTRDITWIEKGVIRNMQTDRYYARQKGIEPASIFNFIIEGGDVTEEEMMKKVGRGVILNNLWYIRPIDMKKGEWTGLTRDGVLYFENGEVKHSVTNFRWNEILHEATKRILALGPAEQIEHNALVPTMLIDDFNFVDVTTF